MSLEETIRHSRSMTLLSICVYFGQLSGGFLSGSCIILMDSSRFFTDVVGNFARTVRLREEMKGSSEKYPFGSAQVFHALVFLGLGLWGIQNILILTRAFCPSLDGVYIDGGWMLVFVIFRLVGNHIIDRLCIQFHLPRFIRFDGGQEDECLAWGENLDNPYEMPVPRHQSSVKDSEFLWNNTPPEDVTNYRRQGSFHHRIQERVKEAVSRVNKSVVSRESVIILLTLLIWWRPFEFDFYSYMDCSGACYLFSTSILPIRDVVFQSIDSLMLRRSRGLYIRDVRTQLLCVPYIVVVGKIHVFSVGSLHNILAVHLVTSEDKQDQHVLRAAKEVACRFGFTRATFEITRAGTSSRLHLESEFLVGDNNSRNSIQEPSFNRYSEKLAPPGMNPTALKSVYVSARTPLIKESTNYSFVGNGRDSNASPPQMEFGHAKTSPGPTLLNLYPSQGIEMKSFNEESRNNFENLNAGEEQYELRNAQTLNLGMYGGALRPEESKSSVLSFSHSHSLDDTAGNSNKSHLLDYSRSFLQSDTRTLLEDKIGPAPKRTSRAIRHGVHGIHPRTPGPLVGGIPLDSLVPPVPTYDTRETKLSTIADYPED